MFNDIDFPTLLGPELLRPKPSYIAKYVIQPRLVHSFDAVPGSSVEMHRYALWSDGSYTEDSRERDPVETLGVNNSRSIDKTKVTIELKEFTGPSAGASSPGSPGVLSIPVSAIIQAQRLLYDMGAIEQFHQSIGSLTLVDDYARWQDRVYINRVIESAGAGQADATQGGYYNPYGLADGSTTAIAEGPAEFTTRRDLLTVVKDMQKRNVPQFSSPTGPVYHCLGDPEFIKALRRDPDFREVAKYPGSIPINAMQPGASPMSAPMMPVPGNFVPYQNNPNQLLFGGGLYNQAHYMTESMPTGFCWEGVRFFTSNNLPTTTVSLNYTAASADFPDTVTGQANRTGYLGLIMGQEVVGEGVYGMGPQVILHESTDFRRFIKVIWQQRSGYAVLNKNFATICRTFID